MPFSEHLLMSSFKNFTGIALDITHGIYPRIPERIFLVFSLRIYVGIPARISSRMSLRISPDSGIPIGFPPAISPGVSPGIPQEVEFLK